jgi:hypothetical protein
LLLYVNFTILTWFVFQSGPHDGNAADVVINVKERRLIELLSQNKENCFDEFDDPDHSVQPPDTSDTEDKLMRWFVATIDCHRVAPAIVVIFLHHIYAADDLENVVTSRDSCQFVSLTTLHKVWQRKFNDDEIDDEYDDDGNRRLHQGPRVDLPTYANVINRRL